MENDFCWRSCCSKYELKWTMPFKNLFLNKIFFRSSTWINFIRRRSTSAFIVHTQRCWQASSDPQLLRGWCGWRRRRWRRGAHCLLLSVFPMSPRLFFRTTKHTTPAARWKKGSIVIVWCLMVLGWFYTAVVHGASCWSVVVLLLIEECLLVVFLFYTTETFLFQFDYRRLWNRSNRLFLWLKNVFLCSTLATYLLFWQLDAVFIWYSWAHNHLRWAQDVVPFINQFFRRSFSQYFFHPWYNVTQEKDVIHKGNVAGYSDYYLMLALWFIGFSGRWRGCSVCFSFIGVFVLNGDVT